MVSAVSFDAQHEDMIHDVQLDYYGKQLATCSSDRTVRIFKIEGETQTLVETLKGHDAPVWQVCWAHPKYGNVLASASYDCKVIIWRESNGAWSKVYEHAKHTQSVNSIAWAPHELGLMLAAGSSDGKISVLRYQEDGKWDDSVSVIAHAIGVNAVSWAPSPTLSTMLQQSNAAANATAAPPRMFVSGGCDNLVKIWQWDETSGQYKCSEVLEGHQDWVRDVAWAPGVGLSCQYIASCSQDKTVLIWIQDSPTSKFTCKSLKADKFPDVVWRVSWSLSGDVLAVSSGDNKITLWKENVEGVWECVSEMEENTANATTGYSAQ
ncbi:GTPase-activating protein S13 [Sorochytrium milnesiophthora]